MQDRQSSLFPRVPKFDYLISTFAPAASIFLLDLVGFRFGHAFLDCLGSAFHQRLGFQPTQVREPALRTSLITPILFAPISFKITSKVVFSSAAGAAAPPPPPPGSRRHRHRSRRAHAPFLFELFYQSSNLENGQAAELLHHFVCICHFVFLQLPRTKAFAQLRPIAIGPDSFCFVARPPNRRRRNFCLSAALRSWWFLFRRLRPPGAAFQSCLRLWLFVFCRLPPPAPCFHRRASGAGASGAAAFCGSAGILLAFAFNNRANAEAGSFNKRTSFVAGDKSKPSNCASKTSRDGNSASTSISFVDKIDLSIIPILRAAILNSAANLFKIFATGATSFSPVTIGCLPGQFVGDIRQNRNRLIARFRKLFLTTCTSAPLAASRFRRSAK